MDNLFKNAKFGDRFRTRDGLMAIFVGQSGTGRVIYVCKPAGNEGFAERLIHTSGFYRDGVEDDWDIVGPWVEEDNFPFDFPSQEEVNDKIKELMDKKIDELEHIFGIRLKYIGATDTLGAWQGSLTEMAQWIKDRG